MIKVFNESLVESLIGQIDSMDQLNPELIEKYYMQLRNEAVASIDRNKTHYQQAKKTYEGYERDYLHIIEKSAYIPFAGIKTTHNNPQFEKNIRHYRQLKASAYRKMERAKDDYEESKNNLILLETIAKKLLRMQYE